MSTEEILLFAAVRCVTQDPHTGMEVMASIATDHITTIPTGPFIGDPCGIPGDTS